jgi:hypothetical protein
MQNVSMMNGTFGTRQCSPCPVAVLHMYAATVLGSVQPVASLALGTSLSGPVPDVAEHAQRSIQMLPGVRPLSPGPAQPGDAGAGTRSPAAISNVLNDAKSRR